MTETIFTLNARENVLLDLLREEYNLDKTIIYNLLNKEFNKCVLLLEKKKIHYQDLKHSLIPSSSKNEIALVFDRRKINSWSYGYEIFSHVIPLLDLQSCNSILCGDYTGDTIKEKLSSIFFKEIISKKPTIYITNNQYFIIYINNLSHKMVQTISDGLDQFQPYVGYFNLTYSSFLKTYLSFILVNFFVKCKTIILTGHDDPENSDAYENPYKQLFLENGFTCSSIPSPYFGLFLSYKIERKVYPGFDRDTDFSINLITTNVLDISDFEILVEEKKLLYLLKAKTASLETAGLINMNISDLEANIKDKIAENYIYNLTFLEKYSTIKFDIIIETKRVDKEKLMKLIVALEYNPSKKILRLITMF